MSVEKIYSKSRPILGKIGMILWIVIHTLLLPIMIPVQFIIARLYWPSVKNWTQTKPINFNLNPDDFDENTDGYLKGDGSKFIGMSYASRSEYAWNETTKFWDKEHTAFYRHDEPDLGFSTDMLTGQLFAIAIRFKEGKMTQEEKTFVSEVFWKLSFCSLPPFSFAGSRGVIWTPIHPSLSFVYKIIIGLKMGILMSPVWYKRVCMRILYWVLILRNLPLFLVGHYTHNMWINRNYFEWTYGQHSDAIIYAVGFWLKIPFASKGLRILNKRNAHSNPDIAALVYQTIDQDYRHKETVYGILTEYIETKKTRTAPDDHYTLVKYRKCKDLYEGFVDFFAGWWNSIWAKQGLLTYPKTHSLKDMMFVPYMLPDRYNSSYTIADYTWERMLHSTNLGQDDGDLDIRFPLFMIQDDWDFMRK